MAGAASAAGSVAPTALAFRAYAAAAYGWTDGQRRLTGGAKTDWHLERGTHPQFLDGSIVRRVSDGRLLLPTPNAGRLPLMTWVNERSDLWASASELCQMLPKVPRSTLYWILDRPGRPLPPEWGLAAIKSTRGWHFARALK